MFDSIKPEFKVNGKMNFDSRPPKRLRRPIPWRSIIVFGVLFLVIGVLIFSFGRLKRAYSKWRTPQSPVELVATNTPHLVNSLPLEETNATNTDSQLANQTKIEYLTFSDFYQKTTDNFKINLNPYPLPLNVKTAASNYYEVSRQLNLDPGLGSLNQSGLAIINNPWAKDTKDFYGLYSKLIEQQTPLLITGDFLTYYYQNNLKQIFEDIEEKVFYDNLWDINKELYQLAKSRYEERLTKVGNTADTILESERLELAYLAVAIELLKPTPAQINSNKDLILPNKFDSLEAERFDLVLPAYLQADVIREVKLIREAKEKTAKSPVMLYLKNYNDFIVPGEYKANARLNNLYLTLRWLNMVWPLNYKSSACPDCFLDKEDWQINLIASTWLAKDLSSSPLLKQRWAKIYKILYFFKGLRDDFNYVSYRDHLVNLFGEDYQPDKLFGQDNPAATDNLTKFQQTLLDTKFLDLTGGFDASSNPQTKNVGLKLLADFYSPNDYIFKRLTYPELGSLNGRPAKNNLSSCWLAGAYQRCNGFALDIINLVNQSIAQDDYWQENINYNNYNNNLESLKKHLAETQIWHINNYWSTLNYIKIGLDNNRNSLPNQAASSGGDKHILDSALSAWVNSQLPPDKLNVKIPSKNNLTTNQTIKNAYIEPNLAQVNELIANTEMLISMFKVLDLSEEANMVNINLQTLNSQLIGVREIIKKELSSTVLSSEDNQFILDFAGAYKTEQLGTKQLYLSSQENSKKIVKEDLSNLKLLVLFSRNGDQNIISVGPVFGYEESRQ